MEILDEIKAIYEIAVIEYKSIFKGGVVLIGLALAGMTQTFPELSNLGSDARKLQYIIEEKYRVTDIFEVDCNKLTEGVADCKYAKYKYEENHNAMQFTSIVVVVLLDVGILLVMVSFYGFVESARTARRMKYLQSTSKTL
jgi:hypothetical protein